MYALLPMLVLLLWASPTNQILTDLTYDELEELDANCYMLDSCNVRRISDSLNIYTCQCESYCSTQETCCIDSPFRDMKKSGQRQTCRPVNGEQGTHYFMVDQCSPRNTNKEMETLCEREYEEGTLLPIIPVTSTSSNVTYKNYFCFRCNEETDDFLYWNIKLNSYATLEDNLKQEIVPTYDTIRHAWMANTISEGNNYVPVELFYEIPGEIRKVPHRCIENAISNCSAQWKIMDVRLKCSMYTSYVYIMKDGVKVGYRNPHCALCNFENLEKMMCDVHIITRAETPKPFSFALLLDINRSDGEKVGQKQLCESNCFWDPFFKKCRPNTCALPPYVVKDRKCAPS